MSQLTCKRCGKTHTQLAVNSVLKKMCDPFTGDTLSNENGLFDECPDSPTAKHEFVTLEEKKDADV